MPIMQVMYRLATHFRLPAMKWWSRHTTNLPYSRKRVARQVVDVLAAIPPLEYLPPPDRWETHSILPTLSETTVVTVGPAGCAPIAVVKLSRSAAAARTLKRQKDVIEVLRAMGDLGGWRDILPEIMASGTCNGGSFVVETLLPGQEALSLLRKPDICRNTRLSAASVISELHQQTSATKKVEDELLDSWVEQPLNILRRWNETLPPKIKADAFLDALGAELRAGLNGRTVSVGWIHGDYWPANLLATPDGSRLTGIVDWDLAIPDGLPPLDILQLLLSIRMSVRRHGFGETARDLLNGEDWTSDEQVLLDKVTGNLQGDKLDKRILLLLCWLRQTAAVLVKSNRYVRHPLWYATNFEPMARSINIGSHAPVGR